MVFLVFKLLLRWTVLACLIGTFVPAVQAATNLVSSGAGAMESLVLASSDAALPVAPLDEADRLWLRAHPVIRLGVDRDFAPYEWLDAEGRHQGLDAEYFALLEKRLGVKFEPVRNKSWKEVLAMAQAGELDMLSDAVRTAEREKFLLFTEPFISNPVIIVDAGRSGFAGSLERLKGRRVVVEKGYFMQEVLEREHPDIGVVTASDTQEALRRVADGRADAYVGDAAAATYAIKQLGLLNLQYSGQTPYFNKHSMAVVKGQPELAGIIAKALATITPAEREAIANRWMSLKVGDGIRAETVAKYAFGGLILLLVVGYSNLRLRREVRARIAAESVQREQADGLRASRAFNVAVLDALVEHVAVLDADGAVVAVNAAWRRFAEENGALPPGADFIGINYLGACTGPESALIAAGLRDVLKGAQPSFHCEYDCHSPNEERWFYMHVVPLGGGRPGAVVIHEDISALRRAAQAVAESQQQAELALEGADLGLWDMDLAQGRYSQSPRLAAILGYAPDEVLLTAESFRWQVHPEDWPVFRRAVIAHLKGETDRLEMEYRLRNAHGAWVWMLSRGQVVERDGAGHALRMIGTSLDIGQRKEAEAVLKAREARLASLLASMQDVVFVLDTAGTLTELFLPSKLSTSRFLPPGKLLGKSYADFLPASAAEPLTDALAAILAEGQAQTIECRILPDPEPYFALISVSRLEEGRAFPTGFLVVIRDITEKKLAEEKIHALAFFDPLTHLPNRRLLLDRLRQALHASTRHQNGGAVLFLDMDNFKVLNDTHGHKVGDLLLIEVARRLLAQVRAEDTVSRLGGDEFVVVLEDLSADADVAASQALEVAEKLRRTLDESYLLQGISHRSSPSIGVCLYSGNALDVDELLLRADKAMYQAKAAGRNAVRLFAE
jgi:diguanylate cyclase (GGDEF)-like protein/PAS domain S-box-containing protein